MKIRLKVCCGAVLWLCLLLSGCASAGETYYQPSPYDTRDPAFNRVPPSWYDNDPAMRHWYTFPYIVPEQQR